MQKFFGPQFLWEGRLRLFYGRMLGRLTTHYLTKFGWAPFADLRLRNLAMQQNADLRRVDKNAGRVLSHLYTKVHDILARYRRPLVVVNALHRLSISRSIPKIWALDLAKCSQSESPLSQHSDASWRHFCLNVRSLRSDKSCRWSVIGVSDGQSESESVN